MSTRMVSHSAEFAKLLNAAAAEGLERCTNQYTTFARNAVSVPNSGRDIAAKNLRSIATKQLGKRTAGLITVTHKTESYTGNDAQRYGPGKLKSTFWYDKSLETNKVSRRVYPFPSKPGEPPRKRTGAGQRGIQSEFDAAIPAGRVGMLPNAKYMVYLNFGTKRIAARPWIEVTLERNKQLLGLLLQTGAKSVMPGR